MARLDFEFDSTQVEPSSPIELLPPGEYRVQIVRSDLKPTKNGLGKLLELEMDIVDGQFTGRKIWDRLNIVHEKAQTEEIAKRTLSAICRAVGVERLQDSEELHHRTMVCALKVTPDSRDKELPRDQQRMQNSVGGYKPVAGGTQPQRPAAPVQRQAPQASRDDLTKTQIPGATPLPPAQQAAPTAAPAAGKALPWARKSAA